MSEHNDVEELVQHLANLTFLMDFYEKMGAPKNKWVAAEFDAYNAELINKLKEVYDETGKRINDTKRTETRADIKGSESWRSGPTRSGRSEAPSGDTVVRR